MRDVGGRVESKHLCDPTAQSPANVRVTILTTRFRFLLVEDDAGHVTLFERTLRRAGILNELTVLGDGEEALAHLRREVSPANPETLAILVLVDLRLPRMDGLTLIREIRSDPRFALLPVAVMTTSAEPAEEEACRALGTIAFLTKPVVADSIRAMLATAGFDPLLDVPEGKRPSPGDGPREVRKEPASEPDPDPRRSDRV